MFEVDKSRKLEYQDSEVPNKIKTKINFVKYKIRKLTTSTIAYLSRKSFSQYWEALRLSIISVWIKILNSLFLENSALEKGGAIYQKGNIDLIILNSSFIRNKAKTGGVLLVDCENLVYCKVI